MITARTLPNSCLLLYAAIFLHGHAFRQKTPDYELESRASPSASNNVGRSRQVAPVDNTHTHDAVQRTLMKSTQSATSNESTTRSGLASNGTEPHRARTELDLMGKFNALNAGRKSQHMFMTSLADVSAKVKLASRQVSGGLGYAVMFVAGMLVAFGAFWLLSPYFTQSAPDVTREQSDNDTQTQTQRSRSLRPSASGKYLTVESALSPQKGCPKRNTKTFTTKTLPDGTGAGTGAVSRTTSKSEARSSSRRVTWGDEKAPVAPEEERDSMEPPPTFQTITADRRPTDSELADEQFVSFLLSNGSERHSYMQHTMTNGSEFATFIGTKGDSSDDSRDVSSDVPDVVDETPKIHVRPSFSMGGQPS